MKLADLLPIGAGLWTNGITFGFEGYKSTKVIPLETLRKTLFLTGIQSQRVLSTFSTNRRPRKAALQKPPLQAEQAPGLTGRVCGQGHTPLVAMVDTLSAFGVGFSEKRDTRPKIHTGLRRLLGMVPQKALRLPPFCVTFRNCSASASRSLPSLRYLIRSSLVGAASSFRERRGWLDAHHTSYLDRFELRLYLHVPRRPHPHSHSEKREVGAIYMGQGPVHQFLSDTVRTNDGFAMKDY